MHYHAGWHGAIIARMGALSYLDFDLQIDDLGAGSYRVYVLASPAGQAEAFFNLPFSDLEIENFFLRIGRPRRGIRRINSAEMNEARKFGSKLHEAVFQDSVQACLLRSIDFAQHREQGLRLRLRLPPSLIELPWEYLYDPAQNRFLVHSTSTPVVRYLDLPQVVKPLAAALPLKVLVMIASPHDYQPLDVEAEWQKIKAAVATLEERGLVQLTRLPLQQQGATLAALQKRLRSDTFQIFHFIGHGGFDEQTQDGVLLFEMEDGRSRLVSGNYLGTLLHDQPSLRLAILNACEGARTTQSDPFAGVAQQLVRQGIPAVIAMQNEITDGAAIQLAHEFYDALSAGYPVDGALAEARKALFAAGNDIEWGTPVLYLRASDGKLFDLVGQPTGQAAPRPAPGALAQPIPARQDASLPAETATAHGRRPWLARWGLFLLVGALVLAGGLALWRWNPDGATNAPAATPMATSAPQATAGSGAQPTAPAASQAQPATPILSASEVASRTILLVEASDALGNSDTTTGKRIYEQLLAANPADVEALVGLARALRQEGNNAEALRALAQANAIAPDSPTANFALGVLYFEEFDSNQQAIEHLTRALEDASPDLKRDAYAYRALVHAKKGDYASAIADMDAIIADDASSDDYVQRAQFHQAQGDDVAAARDFTAAIDRAPGVGKYYLYRADFYANLNQVDKALADYGTFLKIRDPGGSQSEIDRAENYIRLHNPAQMSVPAPGPANDKAGLAFTNTVDGAQYVFVPAGPFDMGLDEGRFDEKPRHEVELDAFWIMQTEVTNEQYEKCVIADVCSPPFHPDWGSDEFWATYDRHPVTHVTWEQATTYAQWAGGRLPTEAEWEKAARGIDGRRYPWGNTVPKVQRLNFNNDVGDTQPVGSYPDGAGPYGTLDMAGNVWEWVADWYAEDYYATSPRANPTGPAEGERRIRRGGSFRDALYNVGATYRDWAAMTDQNDAVGFRVVQEKAPE
jgi:formylglycine-generating enzyme required for sulfatase activity/CHAT domain-containing protein/Flp pilus assembly protein TadD